MPIATSILLAGAALAIGVGTAAKSAIDAKKQAAAAKKAAKAQAKALKDANALANAADPTKTTGADVEVVRKVGDDRKRGKGSLAARKKAASLGGLGAESAAAVGGL